MKISRRDFNKFTTFFPFISSFYDFRQSKEDINKYCWDKILKAEIFEIFNPIDNKLEFPVNRESCIYSVFNRDNKLKSLCSFGEDKLAPEIHTIENCVIGSINQKQRVLNCFIDSFIYKISNICWQLIKTSSKDFTIYRHEFNSGIKQIDKITNIYNHNNSYFLSSNESIGLNLSDKEDVFVLSIKNALKIKILPLYNNKFEIKGSIDMGFSILKNERTFYIER